MQGDIEATDKLGPLLGTEFFDLTDSIKIAVRKVNYLDKEFIDVRSWVRFRGRADYFPSKKGIFLEKRIWIQKLMPALEKLLGD